MPAMSERTFKFTKEKLQKLPLPPAGNRVTFRDSEVAGLELRVTANGVKTFSWYRRVKNGDPERVTIGRFPETTVQQARDAATTHNAARVGGDSPATVRRTRRNELIFSELFDQYMECHAKVHKKTWEEDRQRYDQYLARPLGSLRVTAVTRQVVSRLHSKITTDGHPAVANRVLALVSTVFGRAVEWSIVETNPVRGIRRNREVSRDRFLQSDEMPRFFAAVMDEPNDIVRDFFQILLFTGARRDNVLSMAWSDINLDGAVWRIPMTKAGESLTVPLVDAALDLLKARRAADPSGVFVFPGTGTSGHLIEPKKAWRRVFDRDELFQIVAMIEEKGAAFELKMDPKTGFEAYEGVSSQLSRAKVQADGLGIDYSGCRLADARIHDVRRTMGSWQAMTGSSLNVIGKSLGHKNVATTAIYARLQLDPVRESMERATAAMLPGIAAAKKSAENSAPSEKLADLTDYLPKKK